MKSSQEIQKTKKIFVAEMGSNEVDEVVGGRCKRKGGWNNFINEIQINKDNKRK